MATPTLKFTTFSCVIEPPNVAVIYGGGEGNPDYLATVDWTSALGASSLDWAGANVAGGGDAGYGAATSFNDYAPQLLWDVPGSNGPPQVTIAASTNPDDYGALSTLGNSYDFVDFAQWARAKNYAIGHAIIGNDVVSFDVLTVLVKATPGGWTAIGTKVVKQQPDNTAFAIVVGLVAAAVGAGWAVSIGNSFVSGNYAGIATAALTAYAAPGAGSAGTTATTAQSAATASTAVSTIGTGAGTVDDSDYSDFFDGYDFSSGESTVAFGDAMNVNYGFSTGNVFEQDPQQVTGIASTIPNAGSDDTTGELDGALMHNATPEVTTSDFGTSFTDNGTAGGDSTVAPAPVSGIPLSAAAPAASALAKNGTAVPAATTSLAKGSVANAPDVGSTLGSILNPLVSAAAALSGTASQVTTAQPRNFFGQLAGGGATASGGIDSNTLLICGAALIGLALLLHFEG